MVTNVFSLTCRDGKLAAGFDWALRVTAYIKQQFPGSDMEVVRNIGGPFYELHMVTRFESLAAYDDLNKRSSADEGYQKLASEAQEQGLFIGSSITERMYETVS